MNVRIVVLLGLASLRLGVPAIADADGDALARRFLGHLEAVAPVAGIFSVETRFDPEVWEDDRRAKDQWAASHGYSLRHGPKELFLRCDWAWDGIRESFKSLEGSSRFEHLYRTPEALVRGMAEKNYNLTGPDLPPTWRPASFYLLAGRTPWSKFLSGCRFSSRAAPADAPDGSMILIARSRDKEARLLIDESSGALHQYEIDLGGSPYSQLAIDRLERSPDGQAFPSRARLTIFLKKQPYQFMTLNADRITFRPAEVAKTMGLVLPAGTRVHDRILKRVIPIARPTPVEAVLADRLAAEAPVEHPLAASLPTTAQVRIPLSSSRAAERRAGWIVGGSIAVLAVIGVWAFLKGGRIWDRSRPNRS